MENEFYSNYVAPECFEANDTDLSAYGTYNDVWSLGLLIFKLVFKKDLVPEKNPGYFFKNLFKNSLGWLEKVNEIEKS
jgi:serine/threonine protein kinase